MCGLLGISYQLLCLCLGVLPIIYVTLGWDLLAGLHERQAPGGDNGGHPMASPSSSQPQGDEGQLQEGAPSLVLVRLLIGGVVASRSGLWLFDLAVTQLVQEQVAQHELGEEQRVGAGGEEYVAGAGAGGAARAR